MTSPTVDPIEIQMLNGVETLFKNKMRVANGYYYDCGDVNLFDLGCTENFPAVNIKSLNEFSQETTNNCYYILEQTLEITMVAQSEDTTLEPETLKTAAKLAHDLKKLFGVNMRQPIGAWEFQYTGHNKIYSNNCEFPTGIKATVKAKYYENRQTPSTH